MSGASDVALSGSCLCGGVRFEVTQPLGRAGYCHCTRCQRRTGSGSSAQVRVCGECGAHLWSRDPESGEAFSVRMAAFDGDPGVRPSFRQFVDFAAPWEPVPDDGLERVGGSAWTSAGTGNM